MHRSWPILLLTPHRTIPARLLALVGLALPITARASTGGDWIPVSSMNVARQETGIARVGNTVYVVGGLVASNNTSTDAVEGYEILTDTWTVLAPLPVAVDHAGCDALNGLVYVVGGYQIDFNPEEEMYVYDPVADEWTTGDDLPEPRGAGWMVAYDGKLYHFGGLGPTGATATTYIWEPGVGWTEGMPMPTPREHTNAVRLGDHIYVIGGRAGASTGANERYDPATDTWTLRADMPTPRSAMAMAVLDGKIYCAGGEIPQLYAVNEVFDPVANAWDCREPMTIPRHGVAAIPIGDRMLVPGGGVIQGLAPTDTVDVFVPGDIVDVEPTPSVVSGERLRAAPSPFASETVVTLRTPREGSVTVAVYDVTGRLVRELLRGARLVAGEHHFVWDGRDDRRRRVAPGVYVLVARSAAGRDERRITYLP